MWVVKGSNNNRNPSDLRGSCNCSCPNCKANFNHYMDSIALIKVLQDRVNDDEKERSYMIEQVDLLEKQQKLILHQKEEDLKSLQECYNSLGKSIETERKLRIEEMYKLEFQKKEMARVEKEITELRKELAEAIEALPNLQKENKVLKERAELDQQTIARMSTEMEQYNYDLVLLEELNTRLRVRLSEAETKLGDALKVSMNNMSKSCRSKSINMNVPLPTLKSSLRYPSISSTASPTLHTHSTAPMRDGIHNSGSSYHRCFNRSKLMDALSIADSTIVGTIGCDGSYGGYAACNTSGMKQQQYGTGVVRHKQLRYSYES